MMRRLLLSLMIGLAFFFTLASLLSCRFFESTSEGGSSSAVGLFSFSYRHQGCYTYRDLRYSDWGFLVDLSATTKFAQTMGIIAGILGATACLLTLLGSCLVSFCTVTPQTYRLALAGSIWGALFSQVLTFVMVIDPHQKEDCDADDVDCKIGIGGLYSLFACLLYFLAGTVASALALKPPHENAGTNYLARWGKQLMGLLGLSLKQHPVQTFRILPDGSILVLSILLFHASLTVLLDCRFYNVHYEYSTKTYQEGLFRYYYPPDNKCKRFEKGSLTSFTTQTKVAIAFCLLAIVWGGLLLFFLASLMLVFNGPPKLYRSLPVISFLAAVCQSLVFLGNKEREEVLCEGVPDQSCQIGEDAILCVATSVVYFLFLPALHWYSKNPNWSLPLPTMIVEEEDIIQEEEAVDHNKEEEDDEAAPLVATKDTSYNDLPPPEIDTETGDYSNSNGNQTATIHNNHDTIHMASLMVGEGTTKQVD